MTKAGAGRRPLRFGVFDWVDDSRRPLAEIYEQRLKLVQLAESSGFWCYHVAEHHGTPLGLAPSPNLFLAAAAARTRRIRLGSMVNILPLYDPVRLAEEVCMLDHLTKGRLELGVGRGGSPGELGNYGLSLEEAREAFGEVFAMLLAALREGRVDHEGKRFTRRARLPLRPFQVPYPPLWYPTSNPETVGWIAEQGLSTLFGFTLSWSGADAGATAERYARTLQEHRDDAERLNAHVAEPLCGHLRHVHVAGTDAEAHRQAKAALSDFFASFNHVWLQERGKVAFAFDYDAFWEQGFVLAGSAASVREQLDRELARLGGNYFVGAFAFGSLSAQNSLRSLDLFAREVMPGLATASADMLDASGGD
jgi:alkanesulfonate monooxygenase SsuD/methylene tetrahydromethanopterin reductase-like flavin-dependent oxidoreductase (luciferase family)